MADNLTKEIRTKNMSHIRSENTMPEEKVRKYLFSKGFRYRKNDKGLPGSPDIVLPKYKTVIFINGCFWHKHNCPKFVWPKTNKDYWTNKIRRNVERDQINYQALEDMGWKVIVIWECETKKAVFESRMQNVICSIKEGVKENNG